MRPRWPGRNRIWLRPKLVTPSIRRSGRKRSAWSGSSRAKATPVSMTAIVTRRSAEADPGVRLLARQAAVVAAEAALVAREGLQPGHPTGRGEHADVAEPLPQARAGGGEQVGGEPDLGPLAEP